MIFALMQFAAAIFLGCAVLLLMAFAIGFGARRKRRVSTFERVTSLLESDAAQISAVPGLAENLSVNTGSRQASKIYGLTPSDPIRVNGPIGELTYISRLSNRQGHGFVGHRLGSIRGLDVFEVVSTDGQEWLILWFDMYWDTKDVFGPPYLQLASAQDPWPDGGAPGLSATNSYMENFPINCWSELIVSAMKLLGFPAVKPIVKLLDQAKISRPLEHRKLLQKVLLTLGKEDLASDLWE
jgi:hypothetical protein